MDDFLSDSMSRLLQHPSHVNHFIFIFFLFPINHEGSAAGAQEEEIMIWERAECGSSAELIRINQSIWLNICQLFDVVCFISRNPGWNFFLTKDEEWTKMFSCISFLFPLSYFFSQTTKPHSILEKKN